LKPLLSLIFIDNHSEYDKAVKEAPNTVECIAISSVNHMKEIDKLNYAIRMVSGKYVSILRKGDVLINDFINEVLTKVGERRDVILFDTVDRDGIITSYTTSVRTGIRLKTDRVSLIQYFHPIAKGLLNHVFFNDIDRDRDIFAFYSKKINAITFDYSHTKKVLLRHDTV
jgi:hypothetical protein